MRTATNAAQRERLREAAISTNILELRAFSVITNIAIDVASNVAAEIEMTGKRRLIAVHTERVTIALPARLKREVFDAAECRGVPASEFIRNAIAMAAASPHAA